MALIGLIDTSTGKGITEASDIFPSRIEVAAISGGLETLIGTMNRNHINIYY